MKKIAKKVVSTTVYGSSATFLRDIINNHTGGTKVWKKKKYLYIGLRMER